MNNVELYTDDLFIRQWYHIRNAVPDRDFSSLCRRRERQREKIQGAVVLTYPSGKPKEGFLALKPFPKYDKLKVLPRIFRSSLNDSFSLRNHERSSKVSHICLPKVIAKKESRKKRRFLIRLNICLSKIICEKGVLFILFQF